MQKVIDHDQSTRKPAPILFTENGGGDSKLFTGKRRAEES